MDILHAGADLHARARRSLDAAAQRGVREPGEAKHHVDMHLAETEAQVAGKLLQRGQEMHDRLLDVLA